MCLFPSANQASCPDHEWVRLNLQDLYGIRSGVLIESNRKDHTNILTQTTLNGLATGHGYDIMHV